MRILRPKGVPESKLRGLKIFLVGLLLAVSGLGLFLLDFDILGRALIGGGVALGIIGMGLHFYAVFSRSGEKK